MTMGHVAGRSAEGFTWRAPSSGRAVVAATSPHDAANRTDVEHALLAVALWIVLAGCIVLSVHARHTNRAQQQPQQAQAFAATPAVFAAPPEPTVAASQGPPAAASTVRAAPPAPVPAVVKVVVSPAERSLPKPSLSEGASRVRAAARDGKTKSETLDEESALAVDTLTRSRLETTF